LTDNIGDTNLSALKSFVTITNEELAQFINAIKSASNYDFSEYSVKSFMRRTEKVLVDNKLDIPALINKIKKDKSFLEQVVKDITVNTTELFRDPKIWQTLRFRILPKFTTQNRINIWHAGCSTGQEVYSMLILLNELDLFEKANIFATDINLDVLDVAKKGEYKYRFNIDFFDSFNKVIRENPFNFDEYKEVPYEKYFDIDKNRDTIRMKPFLLRKPLYRKHDLVKDGNVFYTKFDLIMCRNVLIYFNHELQNRIFDTFQQSLFDKGYLVLGAHESMLGAVAAKYVRKGLVYQKK